MRSLLPSHVFGIDVKAQAYSTLSLFILTILTTAFAAAQPALPDVAAIYEHGSVMLTWNCQYNGVRAISVMRSRDSVNDYEIVGYVKNISKGEQSYEDTHPLSGKVFYKLSISFRSGLNWKSNHVAITIPAAEATAHPPQQEQPAQKPGERESDKTLAKTPDTCKIAPGQKQRPTVSITEDTTHTAVNNPPPHTRIVLKPDSTPDMEEAIIVKSRYMTTDPVTGHVDLSLPDDLAMHRYSIKFYDRQNHVLFDVPKLNASQIIFDKRNFQRKGTYRFVIRRDNLEFESGYVRVDP